MLKIISTKSVTSVVLAVLLNLIALSVTTAHSATVDDMVFFQNDHLGSAIVAVNENGDICWNETYTPYGDKTLDEDVGFGSPAGCGLLGQKRGYTGHTEDAESGLTYMQQRFYDPSIGRFLSIDPISVDPYDNRTVNRYSYAANSPYRYTDPTGEAYGDPNVPNDNFPKDLQWTNEDYDWNGYYVSDNKESMSNALDRQGAAADQWQAGYNGTEPIEFFIGGAGSLGGAWGFLKKLFGGKVTKRAATQFEKKIEKQMGKRGWDKDSVGSTIDNPNKTVSTRDTRWNSDGTRRDDPATAYIRDDGHYVVRSDNDGTIVQISNRNKADWKSPFE